MEEVTAEKLIETAIGLLQVTKVPKKLSYGIYEGGSDTDEGYLENLRIARKLLLWAMKEVKP